MQLVFCIEVFVYLPTSIKHLRLVKFILLIKLYVNPKCNSAVMGILLVKSYLSQTTNPIYSGNLHLSLGCNGDLH